MGGGASIPRVFNQEKYREAWSILQTDEQEQLENQLMQFKSLMGQLEDKFANFLLDENHWTPATTARDDIKSKLHF